MSDERDLEARLRRLQHRVAQQVEDIDRRAAAWRERHGLDNDDTNNDKDTK